jgi:predicted O-linked N-acetylglucosamine transferase (SPINDLY family)
MGVPVVTLIGDSHAGRVGTSLLTHAGLAEDTASAVHLYIDRAVALARSPELRAQKRHELRKIVGASVLMDPHRYARALEAAWEEALESAGAALI